MGLVKAVRALRLTGIASQGGAGSYSYCALRGSAGVRFQLTSVVFSCPGRSSMRESQSHYLTGNWLSYESGPTSPYKQTEESPLRIMRHNFLGSRNEPIVRLS